MTRQFLFTLIAALLLNNCSLSTKGFVVIPHHVTSSDTVTIHLPQTHPAKLAIEDPQHVWFTIQDIDSNIQFMSDKAFRQATTIRLRVSSITGVVWVNGKPQQKRVFVLPGKYTLYLADNLETEPENTFSFIQTLSYTP